MLPSLYPGSCGRSNKEKRIQSMFESLSVSDEPKTPRRAGCAHSSDRNGGFHSLSQVLGASTPRDLSTIHERGSGGKTSFNYVIKHHTTQQEKRPQNYLECLYDGAEIALLIEERKEIFD
ncbi:hypothetical protein RF11_08562 [Thelohanellus kitauei]|uniref:Uncharacterized protein n=1 Tax=Thelohanellus kitauei TaxID=669202 RepID=A0A0C2M3R2_THEKT|nr:hypothetical protein RF11_08562 [Thelohanellus kitauei]